MEMDGRLKQDKQHGRPFQAPAQHEKKNGKERITRKLAVHLLCHMSFVFSTATCFRTTLIRTDARRFAFQC